MHWASEPLVQASQVFSLFVDRAVWRWEQFERECGSAIARPTSGDAAGSEDPRRRVADDYDHAREPIGTAQGSADEEPESGQDFMDDAGQRDGVAEEPSLARDGQEAMQAVFRADLR